MSPDSPAPDASSHRDRSIRLAVWTSLISKLGTIVLRLISIPVAIRLLGIDQFGVYAAITMAVGLIDMLHVGIGPALTRELSRALAAGDRNRERTVFATGIILSTGLTLLAGFGAAFLLYNVPIPKLFGQEFAPLSEVMYRAAWIGLVILVIEMICITFEMARDGYLETRFTNAWGAAGNIVGAGALLIGIWWIPTIEFLLIAVNGSIALAKLGNTIHLLVQRPYLLPRFRHFRSTLVRPLALDGVRFSVTYILAAMVEYNLMAFLIGRVIGPEAVGVFNVMITIHFSLAGVIGMFTKPYWPALMDAFERRDRPWILRSSRKLRLGGIGFAALVGMGLVSVGPILLPMWASEEFSQVEESFQVDRLALLAFSCYFLTHIWRHMNQTLALGVGMINPVVTTVVMEALFLLSVAGAALVHTREISWIYFAMAGSTVLFTGWMFPLFFRRGVDHTSPLPGDEKEPSLEPVPTAIP